MRVRVNKFKMLAANLPNLGSRGFFAFHKSSIFIRKFKSWVSKHLSSFVANWQLSIDSFVKTNFGTKIFDWVKVLTNIMSGSVIRSTLV